MNCLLERANDVNAALLYAPRWARDQARAAPESWPAPPIEWPPPGRRFDTISFFGDDRALLEARRELALQPERVPGPPPPDPSDQIIGKTALRISGVACVAAIVAWTLVSTPDVRALKHGAQPPVSVAEPIAINSGKQGFAPASVTPLYPPDAHPDGDEVGQEGSGQATLGVSAADAAGPAVTQPAPATVLERSPEQRIPLNLITRQIDRDELAFLMRRGEDFTQFGDLAAARLMFRRAAEAGDVRAALALASTFDPNIVQKLGIHGLAANAAMARLWYERAAQFGSTEAPQRLQQLATEVDLLP